MGRFDTHPTENTSNRSTGHRSRNPSENQSSSREGETKTTREPEAIHVRAPRRRFVQLVGTGIVLSIAGCSNISGKAAKDQVNYQDHPKGDQQCSNCQYYTPPQDGENTGTCSRVEGAIEPDDWCNVYYRG